jgi:predicted metalloprotease with PDZ domain
LTVQTTDDGWRLDTAGSRRTGFIYTVDLRATPGSEQDVRRHISTPVAGGVRVAGFEIFLEPLGVPVNNLTVLVHNPTEMPLLVPWPALVRNEGPRRAASDASLGFGQGFRPAEGTALATALETPVAAAPVPANLMFHPRDLADLNNALLICGDIRTLTAQAGDCVIQLATDRDWLFTDEAAMDLVRRIARTEMGFFGSAPTDQITVLLSANDITGSERFDVYGVHTGSSVLVMLDAETTWGKLEEQAASVIAHEMFHGWLGEAVRQTDPTMLWFTEGATTWYAARMLTAAGIWRPDHARGVLGARLDRDYAGNALLGRLPVATAAAEVMGSNEQVRYGYAGGVTACMALDEMLAEASGRTRPLDEITRRLYAESRGQPLTRAKLEETVAAVTGVRCGVWLDTYVYGKTTLPPVKSML